MLSILNVGSTTEAVELTADPHPVFAHPSAPVNSRVFSSSFQYPAMTLQPRTQSSPGVPIGTMRPSLSTTFTYHSEYEFSTCFSYGSILLFIYHLVFLRWPIYEGYSVMVLHFRQRKQKIHTEFRWENILENGHCQD